MGCISTGTPCDPQFRKINPVKTITHHALRICSECKVDAELREITNILLANGYPEGLIKTNIRLTISKFN